VCVPDFKLSKRSVENGKGMIIIDRD
jgi:hypothetical protein